MGLGDMQDSVSLFLARRAAHAGRVVGMTDNHPTPAVSGIHVFLCRRRLAAYEHLNRVALPVWPPLMKLNPGCRDRIAVSRNLVR